jgi:peptidyl-prolyl cis-trans isomerase C/foldase protein PrsA
MPLRLRRVPRFFWGVAGALSACRAAPPPPTHAALVNGETIGLDELDAELRRALAERGDEGAAAQVPEEEVKKLRALTLERLIAERLLLQTARLREIKVSDEDVERELQSQKSGFGSEEDWNAHLAASGLDEKALRERGRARLLIVRLLASEVIARVGLGADDARNYFEAHRDEFREPEQVRCAQILVRTADDAKAALGRLRRGELFEKVAAEVSRSPDARQGGDVGWFARGAMPEKFDEACFTLYKGQISEPVVSPYGVHVFKLLDKRGKQELTFDEARPRIEKRVRAEKESEAQAAYVERLRAQAKIEVRE